MKGILKHNEFRINHSHGISGGQTPTYSEIKQEHAITLEKANELAQHFLDHTELDFQCVYNGCQNRAMVMSLILIRENIAHCKIWNFNPSKIALYNKEDKLNLDDPLGLKEEIYWNYHVAIGILVKNEENAEAEKYVIDPSFIESALKVSEWLSMSNSPNSHYTYLDPEWYEPVELKSNSTIVCNNKTSQIILADCFPELYTGDFHKYSSECIKTMADELAADKQITDFTHNVINNLNKETIENEELISFLTDYKKIDPVLKGEKEINKSHPFYPYLSEYRKSYKELYKYWLDKLNSYV